MKFAWNGLSNIIDSENSTFLIDKNPKFDVFVIILPVEVGIISLLMLDSKSVIIVRTPTPPPPPLYLLVLVGRGWWPSHQIFKKGGLRKVINKNVFLCHN